MRSPKDEGTTLMAVDRAAVEEDPGSKALKRLHLFEQERGLEETDAVRTEAEQPIAYVGSDRDDGSPEAAPRARRRRGGKKSDDDFPDTSPYLEAFQQKQQVARDVMAVPIQPAWRPIGPFSIPHGQTYGSGPGSRPSVSGRVASIAIDPANPNHILLGTAGGGVWETRDGGNLWEPRTDNQPTLMTGAVAFDPSNPLIAYVGTGEGNFYRRLGAGLLRSTDGGTTWTMLVTSPFVGLGFYDLVVDPLNGNHILAATSGNLCESTNGGVSWTVRRTQIIWDLSMHPAVSGTPTSTQEVFAACGDGLQRSTNGGTTWAAVALPGAPASYARMAVCHAPSNGDIVYVFATNGAAAYVWRRDTFGGAFAAIAPPAGLATGQAWYDWFAAVAPNNPNVIYLGAINVHKGTRSAAGTWTWETISARAVGQSIHPDQHAIAFSPSNANVVYIGNDGGLYRSNDAGATWQSLNKGLCTTEFEYLAQHPQYDAWLIGGTQDNGTMRYEGGEVWPHVADGDGGDCGTNASSPYTCFHTYYSMGMARSTTGGGWASWSWIGPNVPNTYSSLFYPPLEVNGSVVAQAGQSVFISTNDGTTWNEIALPTTGGIASALAIPTATRVVVGTGSGNIYRIEQVGGTWQAPTVLGQPRTAFVSDVLVDPTNANRIWATYSALIGGHVYRSDDSGTTWINVSAGLPNIPANAIELDPANTAIVYVGTDVGVYRSTDSGGTWAAFSNGLPNALVGELLFHPASRLLRAGTRNRGVWEIAVDQTTMPDVEVYLRDSVVDTGRRTPSPVSGADPFVTAGTIAWWDSTDIKIESAPFQQPFGVDFEAFEDDRGVFAAGLTNEVVSGSSRVYVQVHNRGPVPAINAAVKVFYVDANSYQALPAGFWINFPNNSVPAGSAWQPIGPHQILPSVQVGRPQVAAINWNAPTNTSGAVWLLAVVSADNDLISTTELNPSTLVLNNPKCALKRAAVLPYCGVQFRGTVPANTTTSWYTSNWRAAWHVIWTVMPTTPRPGGPEIKWKVQVERASAEFITYWINVTNETPVPVDIEGRYCVLSFG
jgi:photosystem II stability/assembly factor-like uncharacterized protein